MNEPVFRSSGTPPGPIAAIFAAALMLATVSPGAAAQEPESWGDDLVFHTFSIAAVDPETGESGVAVTTRVACVGNGVPWVRAGVGAVATQASTRTEYGQELLDMLEQGMSPEEALAAATAADDARERRQVGVVLQRGAILPGSIFENIVGSAPLTQGARKADEARALDALFRRVTGFQPRMWGPTIVGYGRYHYTYASGREGDYLATGFSPRKAAPSIYIMPGYADFGGILDRLGKHKTGKSCLYVRRLSDIDESVLAELIAAGLADLAGYWDVHPA